MSSPITDWTPTLKFSPSFCTLFFICSQHYIQLGNTGDAGLGPH